MSIKKTTYIFLIITILFYGNSIFNKYSLDDEYVTVTNFKDGNLKYEPNHKLVKDGFKGITKIWQSTYANDGESSFDYRPFVTTTFAIEYGIFGQNPYVSHLINVILYFFIIILIYNCLLKLFKDYEFKHALSLLTSVLFLIHPAHTEVVNNLKCRDELLVLLFSLLSLLYYLKYIDSTKIKSILLSGIFIILGLFCKRTGILAFGLIPLSLFFYRQLNKKQIIILVFTLIASISLYSIIKSILITENDIRYYYHFENPLYTQTINFLEKIIIAIQSFGFYIKFCFIPYPFRFYYGYNTINLLSLDINIITGISFIICSFWYYHKYKNKHFLFAFLLFSGCIFPFTNFMDIMPGIVGERLLFYASLGFCILISSIIIYKFPKILISNFNHFFKKPISYSIPILVICFFIVINRNNDWYNKLTLFEHDNKCLLKSAKANSLLGNEYFEMLQKSQKKYSNQTLIQKCIKHYNLAISIDSSLYSSCNNLGVVYFSYLGDIKKAKTYFELAIKQKINYPRAFLNLGNCYLQEKKTDTAFFFYKKAILLNPKEYSAYLTCINSFFNTKQYDKALKMIEITNNYFPVNYEIKAQEGNCYFMKNDIEKSLAIFHEAYQLNPNHALAQFISEQALKTGNKNFYEKYKAL